MAINIRKEPKEKSQFDKYKEYVQEHKKELVKLIKAGGETETPYLDTNDESIRFSILIKKRLEIILGREIELCEIGPFMTVMDSVATKRLTPGKITSEKKVSNFIKVWKIYEIEGYTKEFLYYARELDREAERRKQEEKIKNEMLENKDFWDDK